MKLNTYLSFDGTCREAFEFYERAVADAPPGLFSRPAGFCVSAQFDDAAEGERVFSTLAENGTVQMEFQETLWAKGFGMLIDRFGIPWIVNAGESAAG